MHHLHGFRNFIAQFGEFIHLRNSGGNEQDRSPFCISGGEWSNLDALRKVFRRVLSCWVSFAPSVATGEVAPEGHVKFLLCIPFYCVFTLVVVP